MKFKAGICAYGDQCHRAHVVDMPSEIIAISAKPKYPKEVRVLPSFRS